MNAEPDFVVLYPDGALVYGSREHGQGRRGRTRSFAHRQPGAVRGETLCRHTGR